MQSKLNVLSLGLAAVSLGVAAYALVDNQDLRTELRAQAMVRNSGGGAEATEALPAEVMERLTAIEAGLASSERVTASRPARGPGALEGRAVEVPTELALPIGIEPAASEEQLAVLVDKAVEKKALELQRMNNKKPSMDAFAETLELTDVQRSAAEQEVLRGQREMRALLETPTEDGTVFLDEVVELMAFGMAKPGQVGQRWQKFIGRVMSENVPGTNQTYGARAESVKSSVRDGFRRNFSESQYATFERWKMDPTEVQGIEGSPWHDLGQRIQERAREMGAKIPGDDR